MGHIECGGVIAPIVSIRLEGGNIVFDGERPGPVPAVDGVAAVFGPDGIEFCRGARISGPAVLRGQVLHLKVTGIMSGAECTPVIPGEVLAATMRAISAQPHHDGGFPVL